MPRKKKLHTKLNSKLYTKLHTKLNNKLNSKLYTKLHNKLNIKLHKNKKLYHSSHPAPCWRTTFTSAARTWCSRATHSASWMAASGQGLFSRNGKPLSAHLTHIQHDVDKLQVNTVLDGELYSDRLTFQEIVGLVKKTTLTEGDELKLQSIYLYVYDAVLCEPLTNEQRNAWLRTIFQRHSFSALKLLHTALCASKEQVGEMHAAYVAEGYEGLMLRNVLGAYSVGHRSKDLQKFKLFEDDEFVVCGYKTGDGSEQDCVIWQCLTSENNSFYVRPCGTHEERRAALLTADSMVSRMYTVRYQELTDDGIPRFPVGVGFRDLDFE